jgi:hypothetical protein
MKNNKHLLLMLTCLVSLSALGQTNKKTLNYQAVILDPKAIDIPGTPIIGQPLNKGNVCLRFSLMNSTGGLDYEETQQITTDAYGLVNVLIGAGNQAQSRNSTSTYKSFDSVVWTSNVKSLQVSVSYDGCNNFNMVSSQALNYIPYALYAEAVDYKNVRDAPTKLSQFANDAGYLIPKDLDPVKADIKSNTSQIATANQTIADNKKSSDASFLLINQSITNLDQQVAEHNSSISTLNTMLADQQIQISDNRNQISATNNQLNTQVGVLQGQINNTNSTVSNLTSDAEVVSNKSTATDLGGANPSDQLYPSQKAAKTYVDQSISQIASSGVPDATTLAPGKIQLSGDLGGTATNPLVPALANKANIASPVFTGNPVLPSGTTGVTQSSGDNSTKLATTAFVTDAVGGLSSGSSGVPYTGATGPVDLGGYDLTANGIVIGIGGGDNTNTSIGNASMRANSGVRNTAFGNASLQANTVGTDNTAVGYFALQKNTATTNPTYIGSYNTAVGSYSLQSHTTGTRNTGIGAFSLQTTSTGYDNSAFGYSTLKTNTTGYRNTANGSYTLYFNQTGNENIALGWYSLQQNTSGSGNTALGTNSLKKNTTGNYNTALGYQADINLSDLSNATAIGYNAKANASNSIVLGNSSVTTIGGQVTWTTNSDIRIKKNIRDTHYGLSTVMQLRPVEYTLINSDLNQVGFIAQEVNKLVPEVVTGTEGDLEKGEILGITYANLVAVLTKAIQEQQKQIDGLNKQVEVQSKKIDYLTTLMDAQK